MALLVHYTQPFKLDDNIILSGPSPDTSWLNLRGAEIPCGVGLFGAQENIHKVTG